MTDFDLSELIAAAGRLQFLWDSNEIDFCFIGGLAVHHWGQPRQTNDVDATVWTEFGNERPMINRLLQDLQGRIENADEFAMVNRVLLVEEAHGVNVDISLAAFPFERALIDRAELQPFRQSRLKICGPSDLVIKLES